MNPSKNNFLVKFSAEFILTFLMVISVIPGYRLCGDLFKQLIVTILLSGMFIIIADRLRIDVMKITRSVTFMHIFWVVYALVQQIKLHIDTADKSFTWRHTFFYDKFALIFIPQIFLIGYMVLKLFYNSSSKQFVNDYKKFMKYTIISFSFIYFLFLLYSFVIYRGSGYHQEWNWVPFKAFKSIFLKKNVEYDVLTYYVGNILLFVPIGVIVSTLLKGKNTFLIFVLPLVLSFVIEFYQYFSGSGEPDIEDVILNTLGASIAYCIKILLDKLIQKKSKNLIKSVFII